MLEKFYWKCALAILVPFCVSCDFPAAKVKDDGKDTSGASRPDTVIVDTIPPKNPDSLLAGTTRFGLEKIFGQSALETKRGVFADAKDYRGQTTSLNFDFVAPAGDTMKYRPLVLLVHEGAYLFGDLGNEMGKAILMARRGYAAASINYRLGFNGGSEQNTCGGSGQEVVRAVYRSVQDTYAAIHYFVDRADEFGIDPRQILLAGSSAGAITISALVYMNEADFEGLQPGISKALGPLDPRAAENAFRVRAILTTMGYGLFKSSYITQTNAMPTVFFQRTGDNVLPYYKGTFLSCPSYPAMEGAKPAVDLLKTFKVPFELNYENQDGHHLSYPEEHIVSRYAQFVKRLWSQDRRQATNDGYALVEDIRLTP